MFFGTPIAVAVLNTELSMETGRFLVLLSFILVALALLDWYHLYISNTFSGIFYGFMWFSVLGFCSAAIVAALSGASFKGLLIFEYPQHWEGYRFFQRLYFVGMGVAAITVLSVPRLLLIKALVKSPLPEQQ